MLLSLGGFALGTTGVLLSINNKARINKTGQQLDNTLPTIFTIGGASITAIGIILILTSSKSERVANKYLQGIVPINQSAKQTEIKKF